jgi:hypothetical protein
MMPHLNLSIQRSYCTCSAGGLRHKRFQSYSLKEQIVAGHTQQSCRVASVKYCLVKRIDKDEQSMEA